MPEQAQLIIERRRALRAEIRGGSRLTSRFFILNGLAAVIAAYGLLLNSPATVIGSVVLAQELGPIMGISLALNDGDLRLLRRSLVSEAVGMAFILGISIAIGAMHRAVPAGAEITTRVSPTIMDLAVALAAGAAGAYAATSTKVAQAIVGVAITTSLLPPLAASGLLLARGEEKLAIGAALLFFTNLVAIQFAASVVFLIGGFHARMDDAEDRKDILQRNGFSLVLLLGLAIFLGYNFKVTIEELVFKQRVESSISKSLKKHPGSTLAEVRIVSTSGKQMVFADILTPASISPERVAEMERELPQLAGEMTELHVRSVLIKEATSSGYLHESQDSID
jgi:uncharacterized hydrophobic protein (TIGR00271 family)